MGPGKGAGQPFPDLAPRAMAAGNQLAAAAALLPLALLPPPAAPAGGILILLGTVLVRRG